MGRNKNFYFQNKYWISGVRYNVLLENPENMGKPMINIINENKLDSNISWRFKKDTEKGGLILDLSQVNTGNNSNDEAIWRSVDEKIIDVTKQLIQSGLNDGEITSQVYIHLMKEGYKMENNKLVKNENAKAITLNVCADLGNNFVKTCADDNNVITFLNKIDFESDETMLADNDYIKSKDSDKYYIIGNEFSKFEKNANKKDKNFLPTLQYSIARCIKDLGIDGLYDEYHINLAVLSPINQMKFKDEYIQKIADDSICDCECKVDGKKCDLIISIDNIEIYPEGLCSYPMLEDKTGSQVICDIGSQTANIAIVRNGKVFKVVTLDDMGSFNYYYDLVKEINDNEVTTDNIQRYIDDKMCEHDMESLEKYYTKLFTEIKKNVGSKVNKYNVIGGTVELFKSNGISPKEGSNVVFVENASTINVLGAKKMLDAKYKIAAGE